MQKARREVVAMKYGSGHAGTGERAVRRGSGLKPAQIHRIHSFGSAVCVSVRRDILQGLRLLHVLRIGRINQRAHRSEEISCANLLLRVRVISPRVDDLKRVVVLIVIISEMSACRHRAT